MKTILFLDLEETIIQSWENHTLMNIDKIKFIIDKTEPDEINIFSGAIWCGDDVFKFTSKLKNTLEQALSITINKAFPMSEVIRLSSWGNCAFENRMESMIVVGKFRIFEDFCERNFKHTKCYLVDDACPSKNIVNFDSDVEIYLLNINK